MVQGGYKIRDKEGIHFLTFAVTEWVDVFTRREYRDIVLDSIKHCQKEKGLLLHGWCIMSNDVHLIASATYAMKTRADRRAEDQLAVDLR